MILEPSPHVRLMRTKPFGVTNILENNMETDLTPFFTASASGISGDLSRRNDEFVKGFENTKRFIFPRPNIVVNIWKDGECVGKERRVKPLSLFFDGAISDVLGCGSPILLGGSIERKPIQNALVYNAVGDRSFNAAIVFEERRTRFYGLIVFRHEATDKIRKLGEHDYGV